MKTKVFPALLVIMALLITGYAPAQSKRATSASPKVITVLNPAVASKMAERLPLAPRLDTLEGKTIYMVDIAWGGPEAAYSVFEEMQAWFTKNIPTVKTVIKIKRGGYEADDPGLWKEISKAGNAAIVGVSA